MTNTQPKGNTKPNRANQAGLVSIFVVMFIMSLLALIVLSFTKLMNRELRSALDRELATQANYAAESGLNDARAAIDKAVKSNTLNSLDTNGKCINLASPNPPFVLNGSLSGHFNNDATDKLVEYTCVIIDTNPKVLTDTINRGESRMYLLNTSSALKNLYISWENSSYDAAPQPLTAAGIPRLPEEGNVSTNKTGLVRATLYPVTNALGAQNSSDTQNNTLNSLSRTYFLYPNGSGAPTTAANISTHPYDGISGQLWNGNCNNANRNNGNYLAYPQAGGRYCNFKWSNVSNSGGSFYYLKLTALYQDLNVMIQGSDAGGAAVGFNDDQATIDVTAKGNNLLKRERATVSISQQSGLSYPSYALQSMDTICKRLRVEKTGPGSGPSNYGDASIEDNTSNLNIGRACTFSGF
jgi:Tfp pilus assembly protein PilX